MADMSDLMQYKMLDDHNDSGWGAGTFLWIILIFLFFLAFNGGLFGNDRAPAPAGSGSTDLSQVERDILNGNCATQKEVLNNRFVNELAFKDAAAQMASCCCDLKTTVIEQNQLTRDMIQQQYIDGLRTELSDAKTSISNYNQNQYILGQLGQWYSNPAVNPYTCYGNSGCGCGC